MKNKTKKIITLSSIGVGVLVLGTILQIVAESQAKNLNLLFPGDKVVADSGDGLTGDYIDYKYDSQEDALKNAQEVTQKTAEEGITLLRNDENTLPLSSSKKITILGYYSWHNNMSGGEDPATTSGAISIGTGLENAFTTNSKVNQLYSEAKGEFDDPSTALVSAEDTYSEYDTAVITIKKNSGEGNDQSLDIGKAEQNRHNLTLTNAELKLVDYACKHFNSVIIVINSANAMELGFLDPNDPNMNNGIYTDPYNPSNTYDFSKVKAALWAGCCGSQGGRALANILKGSVNPSGHLVDTYVRDLKKDPTYKNFGSYLYTNSSSLNSYQDETYFVEYEEGIYVGYRYYETAAYEASKGNYEGFDYTESVVYPFGYGLSYTDFSLEYASDPTYDKDTHSFHFDVKVTNIGTVAGKGVAQIYVNVPYENGQVEKAHVALVGFGKTDILQPNASETLSIVVSEDYFTNYDYKTEKCYILDAGDYNFYLSENAHSWEEIDKETGDDKKDHLWTYTLSEKKVYKDGKDGKRYTDFKTATNVEDDELNYKFKEYNEGSTGDGYAHNFTRANFKASFPTSPVNNDFVLSDSRALKQVAKYDVWAEENNDIEEMEETNTDTTSYTLSSMRGVDITDEKWDEYINQFTVEKMVEMFSNGGWNEMDDAENGVPISYDADSPYGYYAHALTIGNINKWYCGDVMVAATYNTELAKEIGDAFGEESHANTYYNDGKGTLITGLYGYGLNIHRSAFGGRNYEYYSEDPVLAGKMAAAEASGASEKGLITFMKHFVLNEQETNRQKNGYCSWVNEQAFREVYCRGWEIYIKEAKMNVKYYETDEDGKYTGKLASKEMSAATGIMTSYNRVGANWSGASLCINNILRDEFNFTGSIVTDAGGQPNTYMTTDYMLRRGGNLTLANNGNNSLYDTESATAIHWLKKSTKYLLYNKANSNCVVEIGPGASVTVKTAPWRIVNYVLWAVVGVLALVDVAFIVLIALNKIKVKEEDKVEVETNTTDEF